LRRVFEEATKLRGVVKCYGMDPLRQFFETLEFAVTMGLARWEL